MGDRISWYIWVRAESKIRIFRTDKSKKSWKSEAFMRKQKYFLNPQFFLRSWSFHFGCFAQRLKYESNMNRRIHTYRAGTELSRLQHWGDKLCHFFLNSIWAGWSHNSFVIYIMAFLFACQPIKLSKKPPPPSWVTGE